MEDLDKKIEQRFPDGSVVKTNRSVKETISGQVKELSIYRIRLDKIYLNDENGRIASFVNDYNESYGSNNSLSDLRKLDLEKYNNTIQKFIEKAEEQENTLNRTMNNIKVSGQLKPGLILLDGRIIDGNRRATCLRKLYAETKESKFQWFETVIVDKDVGKKEIRELEIFRQHGEERPTEFNTVDMLLSIHKDVCENKIPIKRYAELLGKSVKDIENYLETANLMFEYLDFINAPNRFHILRTLDVIGTLKECASLIKKGDSDEQQQDIKNILFTILFVNPSDKNIRDYQRNIKSVLQSARFKDNFIEEAGELVEDFTDILPHSINSEDDLKNFKNIINKGEKKLKTNLNTLVSNYTTRADCEKIKQTPNEIIIKALNLIEDVDQTIVFSLTNSDKAILLKNLEILLDKVHAIKGIVNND